MKYLKNLGMSFIYIIVTILVLTFITTILSYFNILNDKITSIIKIIIPIISMLIGGFYIGKKSLKKGFLEGLKLGGIFSLILIIFNYLALNISFKFKYLLFYLILIITSILGSMIGINKKKQ
ncbi:MAG: TIGR04086 family membrane protein [Bacilli bacterium]|nr:TIGR04086 family membrane protein [Bacilli bacterium]